METATPSGVTVEPLSPDTAVVSDGLRLSLTTDGGARWATLFSFPAWLSAPPLFTTPRDASAWFNGRRMVTTDGGRRWREAQTAQVAAVPPPLGSYAPPQAVAPVAVAGTWAAAAPAAGWHGRPVAVGMGPPVQGTAGQPVPLRVDLQSSTPLALTRPLRRRVRMVMAEAVAGPGGATQWLDGGGPAVWQGTLPALRRVGGRVQLRFTWDGRDSSGQPVPPGVYDAQLVTPLPVAAYTSGGRARRERLPGTPALTGSQTYTEAITLAGALTAEGAP